MPNHVHGIVIINKERDDTESKQSSVSAQNLVFPLSDLKSQSNISFPLKEFVDLEEYKNKMGAQSKNLSSIIRGFKIGVTKYARNNNLDFNWQSRFHDRIIRNENEYRRVKQYIKDNPKNWELDRNNK